MSIISHPNGWNGFAVKCVSQRANLTIAHTTYRYIPARTVERKRWHIWCQIGRYWARGGGGTAPSRWIANCQPKRTLCVLEVIRKYPDSKKKNSMSIKSCIYIVRKELSIFACVCVCVCDKFIRLPQKKKKRKRTCSIHYRIDLCYTTNPSAHMRPSLVFPKRSGELKVCAISSVYRG